MMNLYGGTGMGAAGTGIQGGMGAAGAGGALSPQLMAMLAAMQQGGGASAQQPAAGPMSAPSTGAPMSQYIGAGSGGAGGMNVPAPMGMNVQPQQAPQQAPTLGQAAQQGVQDMTGTLQGAQQMQQLLAKLKGGQTGLPASGAAANAASLSSLAPQPGANGTTMVPSLPAQAQQGGMLPSWLTSMFGGGAG